MHPTVTITRNLGIVIAGEFDCILWVSHLLHVLLFNG